MPSRRGGCLCGAVRYELTGGLGVVLNCHCRYCRRAHGAAFVTVAIVPSAALHWTGADAIREVHTPGVGLRAFCSRCASRLYNRGETTPGLTSLVVASLDDDRDVAPSMHVNVESKASWYEIRDGLPQYAALPPAAERLVAAGAPEAPDEEPTDR